MVDLHFLQFMAGNIAVFIKPKYNWKNNEILEKMLMKYITLLSYRI